MQNIIINNEILLHGLCDDEKFRHHEILKINCYCDLHLKFKKNLLLKIHL